MQQQAASSATSMADLKLRAISGVILAAAGLGITAWGGWAFQIVWTAIAVGVFIEWLGITGVRTNLPRWIGAGGLVLSGLLIGGIVPAKIAPFAPLLAVMGLFVAAAMLVALSGSAGRWVGSGLLYAGVFAVLPGMLRLSPQGGMAALFWLFALVWGTDIGAYFAGRLIGGPKLWPAVSPKKTWSGFIGGVSVGVALAALVGMLLGHAPLFASWSMGAWLILTVLAAALSQGGDLLESAIKRKFDVKDASQLIPGHGGLMDRLDGFWAACLVAGLVFFGAGA
jgi:phosphatidate cytidylyltransferase